NINVFTHEKDRDSSRPNMISCYAYSYNYTHNRVICGMNTNTMRQINMTTTKGTTALESVWTLRPDIPEPTNRLTPRGGVMKPIANATIMTTPKCIGSIPISSAIGSRIGVKIITAADVSINNPTISNNITINIRSRNSFSVMDKNALATTWGIRSMESTVPKAFAVPIIISITTELRAAYLNTPGNSLILTFL